LRLRYSHIISTSERASVAKKARRIFRLFFYSKRCSVYFIATAGEAGIEHQ